MKLFLAGDVMLGRGIDQILRYPNAPRLHESYAHSALDYVALAERKNGPIPRGVALDYVWGDAAEILRKALPDWGIVNLETAVTDDGTPVPKGINYRASRRNMTGLRELGVDCCVLANNHVLDWGSTGLQDTIETLKSLQLATSGAGYTAATARVPAVLEKPGMPRVLVFGMAYHDSGIPWSWAAGQEKPGVNLLGNLDEAGLCSVKHDVAAVKRAYDVAVASIHWGGNWGYDIPEAHVKFARALVEEAGIDLVHGHSSHHPKAWEIYKGKLILYGCGDFINDYEGITGQELYRGDLSAMYLIDLDERSSGTLSALRIEPFTIMRFSLNRASSEDRRSFCDRMNRECRRFGTALGISADGALTLGIA